MPDRSSKLSRHSNQLAKLVVETTRGQKDTEPIPSKSPAAVELRRLGGLKGGKARAAKLSAKKRSQIARKAAAARWKR